MFSEDANGNLKIQLLYELNANQKQLDFAIEESEHQLASVKRRLEQLKTDLWLFVALLVIPPFLYGLITGILPIFCAQGQIFYVLLVACRQGFITVYILASPLLTYKLIETVMLVRNNRERNDVVYTLPPVAGSQRGRQPERAENYRSEYEKLVLVLSRYYTYRDKMKELKKELDADACSMTLYDLKLKLSNFPIYEQIRPSNNSGKTVSREKKTGLIAAAFVAIVIIVGVMFEIF